MNCKATSIYALLENKDIVICQKHANITDIKVYIKKYILQLMRYWMHYFQVKVDMLLQQVSKVQIYLTIVIELRITCFPFQWLLNIQTEKRPLFWIMLKPLVGVSLFLPPLWGFLWKNFSSQGTDWDSKEGPRGAANQRQSANDRAPWDVWLHQLWSCYAPKWI